MKKDDRSSHTPDLSEPPTPATPSLMKRNLSDDSIESSISLSPVNKSEAHQMDAKLNEDSISLKDIRESKGESKSRMTDSLSDDSDFGIEAERDHNEKKDTRNTFKKTVSGVGNKKKSKKITKQKS